MFIRTCLAAVGMSLVMAGGAAAQTIDIVKAARDFIPAVEEATGRPIAVLQRSDNDPATFWYKAMQSLCDATNDNWCEREVRSLLTDTTNQLGWARIITYRGDDETVKTVCALLPPRTGLYPGYVATAISSGAVLGQYELPTAKEVEAYLWLLHTGNCMNQLGNEKEQKRADTFATLALTIIQGDGEFVGAYDETPSRLFNPWRNPTETRWATNIGERLLLDQWKGEVQETLSGIPCNATVVDSTDINTDFITRDQALSSMDDCQSTTEAGYKSGKVTDQNLWIWTGSFGGPTMAMPPKPYTPFKMFVSEVEAAKYVWATANKLAGY